MFYHICRRLISIELSYFICGPLVNMGLMALGHVFKLLISVESGFNIIDFIEKLYLDPIYLADLGFT